MTTIDAHPDVGRHGGLAWLIAGYVGAAGFLVLEAFIRKAGDASSLKASGDDEGTSRVLIVASAVAAGLPVALRRVPVRSLPRAAAPLGLALQGSGLVLRIAAMRTLGAYYTRTLKADQAQPVVDAGPYSMVRHPGYAGALLIWGGLGLAARSAPASALVTGLMFGAYRRRIVSEEKLLLRALPTYHSYCQRTDRLIPHVW
ncbi:methyltransferase family protein [Mycolicibacterium fluoranthenivorans]|uniref:methyltransferase family protein n=1 Tax=Mycolicibacterium fluoranthenivorans TaxID=258505 RepID=UPI001C6FC8D7|nr:isoprenylcysteine carboxylmethyltransferase family protein [Mycolicibacterium fluoranthenivorans]